MRLSRMLVLQALVLYDNMMLKSPCISQCKAVNKKCVSCLRTLDEIRDWTTYDDFKKLEVIERIEQEQPRKQNDRKT